MEIIEKEKVKEVPADYWCDKYGYTGYNRGWGNSTPFASKGLAGTALGIGIGGLVLGGAALMRNGGLLGLFGGNSSTPENVNINTFTGGTTSNSPSPFYVLEKENADVLALQKGLCDWALTQQNQRFADRSVLNSELFGIYKSQVDADFGLYKSSRDAADLLNNRLTNEVFSLYKSTRDEDDAIRKELSDLKAQVAVNSAIRPYQDKLIQCEIDKAFTAGINYTDKKTCNVIYGEVVLPSTPTVTGYVGANQCGCPRVVTTTTT